MTENNAAQAADQEIEAIMEQAQVFASAWSFLGGPFDNGSGLETVERERAALRTMLSKPRAEGVQAGDERAAFASHVSGRDDLELYQVENVIDANLTRWTTWRAARDYYQQTRAALASAPVADEWAADMAEAFQMAKDDRAMFPASTVRRMWELKERYRLALASAPVAERQRLRNLVDVVWNEATESTAVPDTPWADRLIDKVFPSLAASAPVAPQPCPTDVCQAGKSDGVLCANDECDRANGVRPARAPVAAETTLYTWAERFPEISDMGRLRNAWNEARASAPVAREAQPDRQAVIEAIHRYGNARAMAEHNIAYRDEVRNTYDALIALFDAAPQASEAVHGGKWPMLSELHLHALMFAYNEGYSKAYDGRAFPNPFSENGSQAAAWQLGTDDGTEARAALSAQPGAQKEQSDA